MGIIVQINDQALASLINSMCQSGAIGGLPAAAAVIAGSFYYDTTNSVLKQEQAGAWVDILEVKTLNPANETVAAGYYAATTLSVVDADLAVANIKKDTVIFGFTGTHNGLDDVASEPNVAAFQAYPGTGDATGPDNLNDNNTVTPVAIELNEYVEVVYGDLVTIKRWRQFGSIGNQVGDIFKIMYWDVVTDAWTDWVTGIAARVTADWSGFSTETEKQTTKIRVVATAEAADSFDINEMEIIY